MLDFTLLLIFPAAMAFAASMDLLTMTIPNRVSVGLVAAFLLAAPFTSLGWAGFAGHLGAGFLMLVIGIFMFSLGWLGGGDAKLLAAAALWMGFENLLAYVVLVGISGGLLAMAMLTYRRYTPPLWLHRQEWAMRLHDRKGGLPYGIALAGAGLWIYPTTVWFTSFAS